MPNNWTEVLKQPGRNYASYVKSNTPAVEPQPVDMDEEVAIRARKIRTLPVGERLYVQGQIAARIKTMERNQKNGYDWSKEIQVERKVLELSQMGILDG